LKDLTLNIKTHSTSSRELLQRLYKTPSEFSEHLRHTSGAIIMEVSIYVVSHVSPDMLSVLRLFMG
jgi:hypothetical protein